MDRNSLLKKYDGRKWFGGKKRQTVTGKMSEREESWGWVCVTHLRRDTSPNSLLRGQLVKIVDVSSCVIERLTMAPCKCCPVYARRPDFAGYFWCISARHCESPHAQVLHVELNSTRSYTYTTTNTIQNMRK